LGAVAQLERDINYLRHTTAGSKSARRRGEQLGRKKGLWKEAKQKAMLAASYYQKIKLPITDIMKLVGIKSKPTLYMSTSPFKYERNIVKVWSSFG